MQSGIFSKWFVVILGTCAAVTIAAPARVIYVDAGAGGAKTGTSWVDAYNHLQDALAATVTADKPVEIRVAQGVYKPDQGAGVTPGDRAATFQLLNGVTLQGGYAGGTATDPDAQDITLHETVLTGDLLGNDGSGTASQSDNSRNVVTGSGTDRTAVLDGFTITAGSIRPGPNEVAPSGVGMRIDAGSPTVRHCRFTGNEHWSMGGVLDVRNASSPLLDDCTFLNNNATGVYNSDGSDSVLINCRFEGNGRGMEIHDSSPAITGCSFTGNWGEAISARDCNSVLTDCVFKASGTAKRERGIDGYGCNLSLTGCTFTGLRGTCLDAGGGGDLSLFRCTFIANSDVSMGAVHCSDNLTARECTFADNSGWMTGAVSANSMELHDCEFSGNSGTLSGAVKAEGAVLRATNCLFCGNSSEKGPGAISTSVGALQLSNCTFAGNRARPNAVEHWGGTASQCIVWDGPNPFKGRSMRQPEITMSYSNVQGGYPGPGNINVDPCFVSPGYWSDPNDSAVAASPDDPCTIWVAGDYHLKSQGGHWDRATETWVRDEVTSLCIDAGDPNGPLGAEPFPNGGYVNLGAYGGMSEASKSYFGEPICEIQIAGDLNGDCKVDQTDMDILRAHWLMDGSTFINIPPTITLISPQNGAELTYPEPILFQVAASDPDGTVVRVWYKVEYRTENDFSTGSTAISGLAPNWDVTWDWSRIDHDGKHTVWAEAVDNEGARTVSAKITVTLHPPK